ncbi:MAG TPA: class I SAM-dependent methyltransferase [Acidimicrobiales bacterium]|nr:class I SAM-dependent methyltransferase [Acidimicrobiales bacterium]
MGFYQEQFVPRIIDVAMGGASFAKIRQRVAGNLQGEVLEVGFGSGLNVPYYPDSVTRVQAVDPSTVGRGLADKRVAKSTIPVEYVGLDGESLPVETASIDNVLMTWTMCTIPDVEGALGETLRVLKKGGKLLFVEHGLSPNPEIAKWQRRLTPIQRRLFAGCHLDRPINEIVARSGFIISELNNYYLKGLGPLGYMYEGEAIKSL